MTSGPCCPPPKALLRPRPLQCRLQRSLHPLLRQLVCGGHQLHPVLQLLHLLLLIHLLRLRLHLQPSLAQASALAQARLLQAR